MGLKQKFERLRWSLMPERKKQRLLDQACGYLRAWPETSDLLDLAVAEGIGIRFDDSLRGTDTDGFFHRNRTTGERFIALKPCLEPDLLAIPLIHELRHLWQEKELGLTPKTAGLGEKDARLALIVTRVKEADAFAFTDLMIDRINRGLQDARAAQALEKKLLTQSGLTVLSPALQEQVEDFLADKIVARIGDEKKKMEEDFLKHLKTLDSYDRIALEGYHRRYISGPLPVAHLTEKDGHVLGLADIRRALKTGTMEGMPPYMDEGGDEAFAQTVLSGVRPALIEAADLMTAFEKAAARLPKPEADRQRQDIAAKVRSAIHPAP